jgi:hypothetical protein
LFKQFKPADYGFDLATVAPIKRSSRGVRGSDLDEFVKRADVALYRSIADLDLRPGEVPVHAYALGDFEKHGFNRNGDCFLSKVCAKYHHTFVKHAKCYRNHRRRDNAPSYGRVVASSYNEPMGRIELVMAYNGTKEAAERNGGVIADLELEKLARDEDLPVSMSCFLDPDYPIRTRDAGYKRIEDIVVGDYVYTLQGRWRRVTRLNRRPYSGKVVTAKVNGLPLPLELTADHPMWAKLFAGSREIGAVKAKARRYFKDKNAFATEPSDWACAEHLAVGDRLFHKTIRRYDGYGAIDDVNLASFLGYYVAEGSIACNGENPARVTFSCNIQDSLPRRLPGIVAAMYPDVTVTMKPHALSEVGLELNVYNADLATFVRTYMGAGSRGKHIPPEICNASEEVRLAFLGAWFDGDGWVDAKGGHWSTVGLSLVLEGRDLLASLGIPSAIYQIKHPPRAIGKSPHVSPANTEYTLNVSHCDLWRLTNHSTKVQASDTQGTGRTKPASMRWCPDDTWAYRVKEVTTKEVENVLTYNFEVDEDESYSAGGLVSHNCLLSHDICSACRHKSRSRSEYCDENTCTRGGLKNNMGRLTKQGSVIGAENPDPTYVDISFIHGSRQADRIAYAMNLAKAASHGLFDTRVSDFSPAKSVLSSNVLAGVLDKHAVAQLRVLDRLTELDGRIGAPAALDYDLLYAKSARFQPPTISGDADLRQFCKAAADAKIVLSPLEFCLMSGVVGKDAADAAANMRSALPGIFDRIRDDEEVDVLLTDNPYVPGAVASHRYASWAKAAMQHSLDRESVRRALQMAVVRKADPPSKPAGLELMSKYSSAAEGLAREYALYQTAFLSAVEPRVDDFLRICALTVRQNHLS